MEGIENLVAYCARRYKDDIDKAVDALEAKVRALPNFEDLQRALVRQSLRSQIHEYRHTSNTRQKREELREKALSPQRQAAKVVIGRSKAVVAAAEGWLDYYIGSKTLGSLLGKELPTLAAQENELVKGHSFNYRLLKELSKIVPDEKTVRSVVSEKKLKSLVRLARSGRPCPV